MEREGERERSEDQTSVFCGRGNVSIWIFFFFFFLLCSAVWILVVSDCLSVNILAPLLCFHSVVEVTFFRYVIGCHFFPFFVFIFPFASHETRNCPLAIVVCVLESLLFHLILSLSLSPWKNDVNMTSLSCSSLSFSLHITTSFRHSC